METPPSFLELSTMEMAEGQKFEDFATNWRSEAAKHFPPICEAQQIQMFHGTLKGAYYSHLMGHKSTFSEMIMAGKQHFHRPRNKSSIITLPLLLRPRSTGLRLRELLSGRNRPQPHRVNKAAQCKLGSPYSSHPCLPRSPIYAGNY
ncbi:hypothetical protein CRG98_009359 [Punica granatum]|uniref:Uncharacterized protein n=1 Tax=Punica granatum TaxID=22663 RepID=A0A2I0KNZ7_PUNGR|nr:hypothetical protein CRG98_009359 [Punica granatum]